MILLFCPLYCYTKYGGDASNELKMKIIRYGADSQQYGQLYNPSIVNKKPVVIVIHGGYWKDNHSLDTYPTKYIVEYLLGFPVAVWNLEYRRMNTFGDNEVAPYPAIFRDVMEGVDVLAQYADSEMLDLNRVLIIGHSAGGHLATWAASRHLLPTSCELYRRKAQKVSGVISIAGILDLWRECDIEQPEQIIKLLGGTQQEFPKRYNLASPKALRPDDVDITIVHGLKDDVVKFNQALSYCEGAGGNVSYISIKGADHFGMLPITQSYTKGWQLVKPLIKQKVVELTNMER